VDAGLRHLREARLRDPQNPEIRYHLAAALAKIGRKEEAQQELDEALRTKVAFDDIEAARSLLRSLTGP
jgi:Flp pilus assembly protein TadD